MLVYRIDSYGLTVSLQWYIYGNTICLRKRQRQKETLKETKWTRHKLTTISKINLCLNIKMFDILMM